MTDGRAKLIISIAVFLPTIALYQLTCGDTVFWQDAGIYLSVVRDFGVAYQPGFPLYIVLARLTTILLFFVPYVRAVMIFSGLCAAGAAALCSLTAFSIARRSHSQGIASAAALTVGWSTALGYSMWYQANNAEVYTFHALLWACLIFIAAVRLNPGNSSESGASRRFTMACAIFGLGLANHPSMFLVSLLMLALAVKVYASVKSKRPIGRVAVVLRGALIGLACAVVPYLLLPLFARGDPYLVMGDVTSLRGLVRHVTMRTFVSTGGNFGFAPERPGYLLDELWWQYRLGLAPLALGLVMAAARHRWVLFVGLTAAIPLAVVDMLYLKGGEWDMWLIAAWISLAPILGLGVAWPLSLLGRRRVAMSLVGAALALAVTVPQALLNFPYVDRKDNFDARDFGMNHLRKLPRNSILIAKGDPVCSTIAYLQSVENIRPDVSVIWYSLLSEPWYHRWAAKRFPSLVFSAGNTRMQPTEALQAFVRRNYGHGRRIFLNQYYTQIPGPPLFYAQVYSGTLTEIRKDFPQQLDPGFWDYRYSDPLWFRRPARPHGHRRYSEKGVEHSERVQYERDMLYFEVQGWLDWARFHMDRRLFDLVVEAYDRIMTLDPDFGEVNTLNMFAIAYLQIGRLEKARDILLRVVELDPEWPLPYVTLSDISARLGDEPESKRYIEKALDLDPQILQKLGIR